MQIPFKHKVLRVSWKYFLPTLERYGATKNIRLFFDYGYKTMYANSVFVDTKDGIKYRVETRSAKIPFATMFADVAKDKGYNVYMPAMYKLNNVTL